MILLLDDANSTYVCYVHTYTYTPAYTHTNALSGTHTPTHTHTHTHTHIRIHKHTHTRFFTQTHVYTTRVARLFTFFVPCGAQETYYEKKMRRKQPIDTKLNKLFINIDRQNAKRVLIRIGANKG